MCEVLSHSDSEEVASDCDEDNSNIADSDDDSFQPSKRIRDPSELFLIDAAAELDLALVEVPAGTDSMLHAILNQLKYSSSRSVTIDFSDLHARAEACILENPLFSDDGDGCLSSCENWIGSSGDWSLLPKICEVLHRTIHVIHSRHPTTSVHPTNQTDVDDDVMPIYIAQQSDCHYWGTVPVLPINRLPNEILEQILWWASVYGAESRIWSVKKIYRQLALVCRRWRSICLQKSFYKDFKKKINKICHVIPGQHHVTGLSQLHGRLYVTRRQQSHIEEYVGDDYTLQRHLTLDGLANPHDMTSSDSCLFVLEAESLGGCGTVYRVHMDPLSGIYTVDSWLLYGAPCSLSRTHHDRCLIIACRSKLRVVTLQGDQICDVMLNTDVSPCARHAVQQSGGQFVYNDVTVRRVDSGGITLQLYKERNVGQRARSCYWHVCVDDNDCVYVADVGNHRVVMLSPTFQFIKYIVTIDDGIWRPVVLHVDTTEKRMYIGMDDGRVVIVRL